MKHTIKCPGCGEEIVVEDMDVLNFLTILSTMENTYRLMESRLPYPCPNSARDQYVFAIDVLQRAAKATQLALMEGQ